MIEYSVDWILYLGYDWDMFYDGLVSVEKFKELGMFIIIFLEGYKF